MQSDDVVDVPLDGQELDEAVAAVVEADVNRDPERVRALLGHVAADGAVSRDAAADAVAHAAQVVSTPETRVELAEAALADARVTAEHVADIDVVAARLDRFEERLAALAQRLDRVVEELDAVVDAQDEGNLYAVATGVETVIADANAVQRGADALSTDIESFERWVEDHGTRYDRLADDIDTVTETLAALETTADRLSAAVETSDSGDTEVTLPSDNTVEPAVAWFDVAVRYRTSSLLLADLRNESSTLETWADREGEDPPPAELLDRLESLGDRVDALGDQVDALDRSAWTERFGDRLDTVDARLDPVEPPVDWGEVRETLDQHRADAS